MENIRRIIKEFLNDQNNLKKIGDVLEHHKLKNGKVVDLMVLQLIEGELDSSVLGIFLADELKLSLQKAEVISDELFDEVLFEIFDELEENYEERQKELKDFAEKYLYNNEEKSKENPEKDEETEADQSAEQKLVQEYKKFIGSSMFQNILSSQEQTQGKCLVNGKIKMEELKNDFYAGVNAGDKIKVVGILRFLCQQGKLRKSFTDDKRYVDFFSGYLERHQGKKEKDNFLANPTDKKFLISFLRFILEHRLNFVLEESAMLGEGLSMLCSSAGEKEFADMAFGDANKGSFGWQV